MLAAFFRNPRIIILLIALLIVSGLAAIKNLPRSEDPRIANRNAVVLTAFPGASAERVEALVTEVIENKLRQIPEIKDIKSRSRSGLSSITIELKDEIVEAQTAEIWTDVRNKVNAVKGQLPAGASEPSIDEDRGYAYTSIVAISWRPDSPPDRIALKRYAQELQNRLRSVPGTDLVKLYGEGDEEIRVKVNPASSSLLGLTAEDIASAISATDAKVAAGEIHNANQRMAMEVTGSLDSVEQIRNIPIKPSASGKATRLGDVADISREIKSPASQLAIIDGRPAVVVAVRMLPEVRGDIWAQDVYQQIDAFAPLMPHELKIDYLFDQQRYTDTRLSDLVDNIITGFVLIIAVLLLTLGWRSALIVALSLPLTILFSLSVMQLIDLPIHQMSVTGLIVALGIMVDNAIVMADTIKRNIQAGSRATAAIVGAIRHLWLPLMGSTLTTILTFMPIVLMPGPAGEFIGGIAIAVSASLIGSYFISHSIVAALSGRFLKSVRGQHWLEQGLCFESINRKFQHSIKFAIQRPFLTMLLVTLIPVAGFIGASKLPEQFFPPSDRDMLNLEVYLPMSASISQTHALTTEIDQLLRQNKDIKSTYWFIGSNSPSFYYNLPERMDGNQNYAQAMLTAVDFRVANELASSLQSLLDDAFPQAQIIVRRLEQGPPAFSPVELRLLGHSLDELKRLGDDVKRLALQTQDVTHVRTTLNEAVPKIWLNLNENASHQSGLRLTGIARQLQGASDGIVSGSILEQTEQLLIRVDMHDVKHQGASALEDYPLMPDSQQGNTGVPVATLGHIEVTPAQGVITRRNGQRVNTIEIYIRDGVLPATVLNRLSQTLSEQGFEVPAGYQLQIGGESENRGRAVSKLMSSVGIIAVLLIVTVVMSFNSFRLSAIVFAVTFLAAGLGLLSLSLSGYPFGFTSIIGLMGLIGLAINAAIVILSELKTNEAAMAGDVDAITASVNDCSRHISSTTITTIMGFMPLILAGGGFWPPFAIVVAGGTLLTTLVSFYFVPAAFKVLSGKPRRSALLAPDVKAANASILSKAG